MATELTVAEVVEQAAAPQSMTVDGQTVTERSANDIIALDRYAQGKTTASTTNTQGKPASGWGALRPARVVPPAATE